MKFFVFLLLTINLFAEPLQDRKIDREKLSELTSYFDLGENLLRETQNKWLRKKGKELWQIDEIGSLDQKFVVDWAFSAEMYTAWIPSTKTFDKVCIIGASSRYMKRRLAFVHKLWEEGCRFDEVVWLTGNRPLDPTVDEYLDVCATEYDAAKIVWERDPLPVLVTFIRAPMKRPSLGDTIKTWLANETGTCTALFISSQPFCGYHFATIKSLLPDEIDFDVTGFPFNPATYPRPAALTLDAMARWIYQEEKD